MNCMYKYIRIFLSKLLFAKRILLIYLNYLKNSTHRFGMSSQTYRNEFKKYFDLYRSYGINHYQQMQSFFRTKISLYSDCVDDNPKLPTLVVVVKNELERLQLLFDHYRKLGVRQFIVIDNDSSDGTREFAADQAGTRVYLVKENFQTRNKEAWVEKVLAITGYNRWYIVVDSDELIDYVGSEKHSIVEVIDAESRNGKTCLQGYLIDMYSRSQIFLEDCDYKDIPKVLSLFDKDSYFVDAKKRIYGGPRYRIFGTKNQLSKQSIFYFKPYMAYLSCHKLYVPNSEVCEGRSFVIKHYKFLKKDFESYSGRAKKKNYYNNSIEYKILMEYIDIHGLPSFVYENSIAYENSASLKQLPFLNKIEWNSKIK